MNINFIKNSLFLKIFILIFLAISLVLSIFAYQATLLQKKSILNNLQSQAKSMADSISFVNSNSMILDDEIKILEFVYDFVQVNPELESLVVSRKNGNNLIVKKAHWEIKDKNDLSYKRMEVDKEKYKIVYSSYLKKEVFKYTYPIYFSAVHWGWFHIDLSLDSYYKKISLMYKQFLYLAILMLITSLILSYIIANMLAKPIEHLENISKEISDGDLSKRAKVETSDEIGRLSNSFNKMVNNLENSHGALEERVLLRTKELKVLNDTLELRVKEEILKQKEQEQILIQQSKMAAMGEMIGNIAHQWRQPLNALSLVMQNIQFSYKMEELDDEYMDKSIQKVKLLTKTMSKTIDDFRNFFRPNKEKSLFHLDVTVLKSLNLIESTFEHFNIKIIQNKFQNIKVYGFENEFSQTLLNILNNAKDALVENKIKDSKVTLDLYKDDIYGYVIIKDNAGGIPNLCKEKIFEPYFTTKEEGKGTGIGLYMSKIIIEQNMNGKLEVKNIDNGAEFIIKIPLHKDIHD